MCVWCGSNRFSCCVFVVCRCVVFGQLYVVFIFVFFFKQKTAYEMRISDWSSDVCSSDLRFIVSVQEPGPEIYDWLTARLGGLGETTDIVRCPVARETLFVKVALGPWL